jgi:hypothetical protein
MKIGIIGPSKIKDSNSKKIIKEIVNRILGNEIYITPDKGSTSEFFAQEYINGNGKKVYEVLPLDDQLGYDWVNIELGEHINCKTWRNQPGKLNDETEILLCLGYGAGVLIEIGYAKWPKPKPVYVIKELVSGKLPIELERNLDLRYISYKDLEKEIK